MISFEQVCSELELKYEHEGLDAEWAESEAQAPDPQADLADERIVQLCGLAQVPEEHVAAVRETARLVRESPAMSRLFQHGLYWFRGEQNYGGKVPIPSADLGELSNLFHLLLILHRVPRMIELHREKGIPQEITRDTISDIPQKMWRHIEWYGRVGIGPLGWFHIHLNGQLYRIGRLQFLFKQFYDSLVVFRHRTDGALQAFGRDGFLYSADGQYQRGEEDAADAWRCSLVITADTIRGNPISDVGTISQEPLSLPRSDWELVLDESHTVLDTHIAGGEPLLREDCLASFEAAEAFFDKFFPERPFRGFVCNTWMFDSQFPGVLPPGSNIVQFQQLYHLAPTWPNHTQAAWIIFGAPGDGKIDPDTARQRTSLQRNLLKIIRRGDVFHGQMGYRLLPDRVQ
jgi:GNAT-like C-terminal domain/N-acyltransferase N-terminal domain